MRRTYYEGHGSLLHETWTWHPIAVCIKHSWNIGFWCGRDVEMLSWAEQCHVPVLTIRLWFLDFFSLFLPCVSNATFFIKFYACFLYTHFSRHQKGAEEFQLLTGIQVFCSSIFLDLTTAFCFPVFDATVSWPSCSITFYLTSWSFLPSSHCH